MRIERDRICPFDACDAPGKLRRNPKQGAETAVDVEPEVLLGRQIGESLTVIEMAPVFTVPALAIAPRKASILMRRSASVPMPPS